MPNRQGFSSRFYVHFYSHLMSLFTFRFSFNILLLFAVLLSSNVHQISNQSCNFKNEILLSIGSNTMERMRICAQSRSLRVHANMFVRVMNTEKARAYILLLKQLHRNYHNDNHPFGYFICARVCVNVMRFSFKSVFNESSVRCVMSNKRDRANAIELFFSL